MSRPLAFVDTNVLVYAFSRDPRAARAEAVLSAGPATSVQGLNEFANVARRKLGMGWDEVGEALGAIRALCRAIAPLDLATHEAGLRLAARHRVGLYDALMLAAALRLGCVLFHSQDLHAGLVVDGTLRIEDPFA